MTTPHLRTLIRRSPLRLGFLLITLALACFALLPTAQAVNPPPDGGYPGGNTAEGQAALLSLTTGTYNTATGLFSLLSDKEGKFNTAVGAGTLLANVGDPTSGAGNQNTAVGAGALLSNTTGAFNTANGAFALFSNTTGSVNVANGDGALISNTTGAFNTANGAFALFSNTTGSGNTATGVDGLFSNTTGEENTVIGFGALNSNTTGGSNTATGFDALFSNTTGIQNTANGFEAFISNTTGSDNTATGVDALFSNTTGDGNTANGDGALFNNTTGGGNTALGFNAGVNVTTASNVICIGSIGANVDNTTWIGNIRDVTTQNADAIAVVIDSAGQLGTMSSSARFKKEIKPMDKASETILALKPVTFQYKTDKTSTPQFGLIAEQVAEVNPNLVVRDKDGEIYTVRYDAVNAMLLNEFLKQHRKNEEQEKTIAELRSEMTALTATVKEQASQIQKVSAQLEASKSAPQVVNNP